MNSQRNILLMALLLVSFMLFQSWTASKNPQVQPSVQTTSNSGVDVPKLSEDGTPLTEPATSSSKNITISSDVLSLTVNTQGGDILESKLLKYDAELDSADAFILLQDNAKKTYIAQSGLIGPQGIDKSGERPLYSVSADEFTLADGASELRVPMTYVKDGITYTKVYVLTAGNYGVKVEYLINNQSDAAANVTMYAQLKQSIGGEQAGSSLAMRSYTGAAFSANDTHYEKYSFDEIADSNLNESFNRGWIAMLQHYFASAWIPSEQANNQLFTTSRNQFRYIGFKQPQVTIPAGQTVTTSATLWTGPKIPSKMEATAEYLDLTVDYGWLWFIAKPLHWLLVFFQGFVSNWGLAIICITFLVRGAMYPLTKAQYTSMAKMRLLQPKLQAMRERLGDDRQRMSQEMMELYKKEKVNPLGGCFPILLQMPIFIALYWALMESVELRHSPFFGWIQDLSAQDPYYILPILMAVSMFVMQKMSPSTVTDPMQQKIMTFMPIMFSIFFLFFPSGLVLYWLVSNIVSIIQQALIYKGLEKRGLHTREKKK